MTDTNGLDLVATLPVDELARMRRRITFLEAAVVQLLRDERGLREWFTAADLARLRLPGLPPTAQGIARVAKNGGWETPPDAIGTVALYHFSSLPRRAFAALIDRVLKGGGDPIPTDAAVNAPGTAEPMPALPAVAEAPEPPPARPGNATPLWFLPLVRLLRTGGGPLANALAGLAQTLPEGEACPTVEEARAVLLQMGVARE